MSLIRKNFFLVCLFICLVVIPSGCSYDKKVNVVFFEPNNYHVYLYSNGENRNAENKYLSAILNLKISNPELVNKMEAEEISSERLVRAEISEYPTLLITNKSGETLEVLSGDVDKQTILSKLKGTVTTSEAASAIPNN